MKTLKTYAVAAAATTMLLTSCSAGGNSNSESPNGEDTGASSTSTDEEAQTPPAPPAKVSFNASKSNIWGLDKPLTVSVKNGTGEKVTATRLDTKEEIVLDETNTANSGLVSYELPSKNLVPATTYVVKVDAVNADGESTKKTWRVETAKPQSTDFPAVTPLAGTTVGVGHPIVIYFDNDVAYQKAVEKDLNVTMNNKKVNGSWGWLDNTSLAYRPKNFWPENSDITLKVDLGKTQTAPGRWVMEDRVIKFETGRNQVIRIKNSTLDATVTQDGKTTRTMPVSMGKSGFTTRSGVKVIMTQEVSRRMDSATVGIGGSEAYDLEVPYAMRLTATGEFIHGAPWSEYAQGSSNVSHGCTNVSLDNAIWLYNNSLVGDPVITEGTGRATEEWNGLGGIWNYSWKEWQTRSAL